MRPAPVSTGAVKSTGAAAAGSAATLSLNDCAAPPSAGSAVTMTVKPARSASELRPSSPVAGSKLTPSPARLNFSAEP